MGGTSCRDMPGSYFWRFKSFKIMGDGTQYRDNLRPQLIDAVCIAVPHLLALVTSFYAAQPFHQAFEFFIKGRKGQAGRMRWNT